MKRRGFTIVELLIAIVIIAILAVIVTVAYRGATNRAYTSRAKTELADMAKATQQYYIFERSWPADVDRGLPAGITKYLSGDASNWPIGPWPASVYDYDYFTGSDGQPVSQISIRFCPIGGPLAACKFPKESWASGFQVNSSAYWCITGKCRAHPNESDSYPGYRINQ